MKRLASILTAAMVIGLTMPHVQASSASQTLTSKNVETWNFTGASASEKVKVIKKTKHKKVTSYKIYVNNKFAGNINKALVDGKGSEPTLIRLRNGKTFLYVYSAGTTKSRDLFYKFSGGKFKLLNYVTQDYDDGGDVNFGVTDVSGNALALSSIFYGYRTAEVYYDRIYKYKNGKFTTGHTFKASANKALTANRKINFVVKPGRDDVAFTLKKGQRATVTKIIFKGKKVYVGFKKNGKVGYLRNTSLSDKYFD
jgi:hypothetical protein